MQDESSGLGIPEKSEDNEARPEGGPGYMNISKLGDGPWSSIQTTEPCSPSRPGWPLTLPAPCAGLAAWRAHWGPAVETAGRAAGLMHYSEHLCQNGLGSRHPAGGRQPRPGLLPNPFRAFSATPNCPMGLISEALLLLLSWLGPACKSADTWELQAEFYGCRALLQTPDRPCYLGPAALSGSGPLAPTRHPSPAFRGSDPYLEPACGHVANPAFFVP